MSSALRAAHEWCVGVQKADFLACHLFWHMCLFHLENQDAEEVFNIWEKELSVRVKSGMPLDLVDCCSLLMRLEMEGKPFDPFPCGERVGGWFHFAHVKMGSFCR